MDMELLCKTYNVSLTMANAMHLEVVRLYDKDGWLDLTDQQRMEVVGLVISRKKYCDVLHSVIDLTEEQQNYVANMLNRIDASETD